MISFQQVSKSFGSQDVLRNASFQINPGEHVGIVGPNGAGKSTLFELIVGEISPDTGSIAVPPNARIGYLRQELKAIESQLTLLDHTRHAVLNLDTLHAEIVSLERQLPDTADSARPQILRRLGELQTRFEHLGGYTMKNRAEITLGGLGFPTEHFARPLAEFSGGWQMRAELARTLLGDPEILLLDEPSNYLDIPAVEWLQRYLRDFAGTLAMISHDRFLLNTLTTVTIEVANARAERYAGNYELYARERVQRYEQRLAAAKNQGRKREQMERFVERFRAKNTLATRVQSVIKKIEKMEDVDVPEQIVTRGRIRLPAPPHSGREVMRLEKAGLTYDGSHWVLRGVDLSIERGEKTALIGLNGTGKTTLLRILAGQLRLSEGKRVPGHKVTTGYQSQEFAEVMNADFTVYETLRAITTEMSEREARTLLGGFGFSGEAVEKRVKVLSGGEKIRLAFARLLARPPNFLILDEPTTHLDIQSRERLEEALRDYDGTVCLVSHDIEFVRRVAGSIIAMTPPGVTRYPGGYDYYKEKTGGMEGQLGSGKTLGVAGTTTERRAEKRQRAERIQEYSRTRRPLQKRVTVAEQSIEKLEGERTALLLRLSGIAQGLDYAAVNQRLAEIHADVNRLTREWEQAATELERIQWLYEQGHDL